VTVNFKWEVVFVSARWYSLCLYLCFPVVAPNYFRINDFRKLLEPFLAIRWSRGGVVKDGYKLRYEFLSFIEDMFVPIKLFIINGECRFQNTIQSEIF
jgi:hypothetical protein